MIIKDHQYKFKMMMFKYLVTLSFLINFGCSSKEFLPAIENDAYYNEMIKNLRGIQEKFNSTAIHRSVMAPKSNMANVDHPNLQRIVKLAAASYCIDFTLRNWICLHCLTLGRQVKLIDIYKDLLTGSRAFLALDHNQKTINVVYRGSSNLRNWIDNLEFETIEYENVTNAKVHQGFLQCADVLKRKIIPDLRKQIKYYPSYKITFVGHSLGGAIAAISTLEFRRTLNISDSQIQLVTYGEPRIGNLAFADYFTSQSFEMFRVVHNHDLVPHVPPTFMDFYHRRRMIFIGSNGLYNCQPENWKDGTCTLAQQIGVSILDHIIYFNTYLGPTC